MRTKVVINALNSLYLHKVLTKFHDFMGAEHLVSDKAYQKPLASQ